MLVERLKPFEGLNFVEQIDKISAELEKAGFTKTVVKCKSSASNTYYVKDDCDMIFSIIATKNQLKQAVIIDKSFYEEHIKGRHRKVTLKKRNSTLSKNAVDGDSGKRYVPIFSDVNEPLHRCTIHAEESGKAVDHITHSLSICTKDYLRTCTAQENRFNTACYSKIDTENRKFSAPCRKMTNAEKIRYRENGYSFRNGRIISPSFSSFAGLYDAVDDYESRYLGKFRYMPLYDFSETLYAFVAWKMLGWGSEVETTEYNRDYILRNHPEVAKYYQLGV